MAETQISVLNDEQYFQIITENDVSTLLCKLKQLCAIKDVMKRMNSFHENAVRYAKLEAAALMRIVELGGMTQLKGSTLGVARWLSNLSQDQLAYYVGMCEEGLTIYQVWKREYKNSESAAIALRSIRTLADKTVDDFKENGIIDLAVFSDEARASLDEKTANDVIDGVRRQIRKAGGIGVGNGSLEYILPSSEPTESQISAVRTRVFGIISDIRRLSEICEVSGVCITACDVGLIKSQNDELESAILLLFETLSIVRKE